MKPEEITDSIKKATGIEKLNEMQRRMLESTDTSIIITAPTGSGKTLAFTIRMLRNLKPSNESTQAIVIAPSRELVMQIHNVMRPVAKGYKTVALYGGHPMIDEKNSLTPKPDIIIATPGRLLDHLQRGNLDLKGLGTLVLDEYDKTLELGFEGEMKRIIPRLGKTECVIMTSATKIEPIPAYLPLKPTQYYDFSNASNPRSRMHTVEVESFSRDKLDTLVNLLNSFQPGELTIVFVNHRESAERVTGRLQKERIPAILYHGALDQQQRVMAIDLFTNGTTPILIATDLAARGLDINDVRNIIHYHLPVNEQAWTHRNGRTARVDKSGTIWIITSEADNRPEYIEADRKFIPEPNPHADKPHSSALATLHFNAGKKEKISRGDIAGFISASGITGPGEIGKINVHDHYSVAAVPAEKARATASALNALKLKGKKARVSIVVP